MADEIKKDVVINFETKGGDKAEKTTKQVNKNTENLDKNAKKSNRSFSSLASGGLKKLNSGLKAIGASLKALGLGLIIGLVAQLTSVLSKNQKVVDTVNEIFQTISITFNQVFTALTDAYKAANQATGGFDALGKVISGLLTIAVTPLKISFNGLKLAVLETQLAWEKSVFGDNDQNTIKELNESIKQTRLEVLQAGVDAVEAGKQVFNNFSEAVGEVGTLASSSVDELKEVSVSAANEQAKALVQIRNQSELAQAQIQGVIEEYDRLAEQQRQIRDDVRLSIDDRIAANEELGRILEEQLQKQIQLAQIRVNAVQQEIAAGDTSIAKQRELIEAQNELAATEAQITGFRSEQRINEAALEQERIDNLNEIRKIGKTNFELEKLEAEELYEQRKQLIERTISDEQRKNEALLAAQNEYKNNLAQIQEEEEAKLKEQKEKEKKIQEEALKAEQNRQATLKQLTEEGLQSGAQAIGLGKEFAIAKTLFDTFQSARAAFGSQLIPGDPSSLPRAIGAAALATTAGLADLASIKSVDVPNVPGGGGTSGGQGGTAPAPPAFNLVGASGTSSITQTESLTDDSPVQAVVVSREVTSQQQADRNAEQQSTF